MTGVLMLESLTRGNTLKQGDKTPLTYKLLDADGDNLNVAGKTAIARLVHPNYLTIGYEKTGLLVSQDDTVTFTIDNVIPARKYNVEIIVDNKFVFPSRSVESKFTIDKSTLGTEASIIEIVGVDEVVRRAVDLINKELPGGGGGDSSAEVEQARVDVSGHTNATLKERLDKEHTEVTSQLAQTESDLRKDIEQHGFDLRWNEHLVVDGDWTQALQQALDDSPDAGRTIFIGQDIRIDSTIIWPHINNNTTVNKSCTIQGMSKNRSSGAIGGWQKGEVAIEFTGEGALFDLRNGTNSQTDSSVSFRDINLYGKGKEGSIGINADGLLGSNFENMQFRSFDVGMRASVVHYATFDNLRFFYNLSYGLNIEREVNHTKFHRCNFSNTTNGTAVRVHYGQVGVVFDGCWFESNKSALSFDYCMQVLIQGCYFELNQNTMNVNGHVETGQTTVTVIGSHFNTATGSRNSPIYTSGDVTYRFTFIGNTFFHWKTDGVLIGGNGTPQIVDINNFTRGVKFTYQVHTALRVDEDGLYAYGMTKAQVGLGNVDNTSDANKPISTAMQSALDNKVDKSQVLTDVPADAKFTDTTYTAGTGIDITGDVISATGGDSSVEVEEARIDASGNTNGTLKERLDKEHNDVTSELEQKIGGGKLATLDDLDSDIISAIEGGEGTSFNLLSIPKDGSVTPDKTTFFSSSKNLFNKDKVIDGHFVHQTTGVLGSASDHWASELIEVKGDTSYIVSHFSNTRSRIFWYDEGQGNINGRILVERTFTSPSNARYLRFSTDYESAHPSEFQLEEGSIATDYEEYNSRIPIEYLDVPSDISMLSDEGTAREWIKEKIMVRSSNVFDGSQQTEGTILDEYVVGGDAVGTPARINSNYFLTAPIPVEPNTTYTISYAPWGQAANVRSFHDINGAPIGSFQSTDLTFTTNSATYFVKFTVVKPSVSLDEFKNTFMMVEGDTPPTTYEPYGYLLPDFMKDDSGVSSAPIYVHVNRSTVNDISLAYKYDRENDMVVRLINKGPNSLFDFSSRKKVVNSSLEVTKSVVGQTVATNGTDCFGPYVVRAVNNIDGDFPDSLSFTGGNHGYGTSGSMGINSATANEISFKIKINGKELEENVFSGYANVVDIYWTNLVQAANTKIENESGRGVLEERYHLRFDGDKFDISCDIVALEDVEIKTYYGIQAVSTGFSGGKYYYKGGQGFVNEYSVGSLSKTTDETYNAVVYDNGTDMMELGVVDNFGLSYFSYNKLTDHSLFTTADKTYFNFIRAENDDNLVPLEAGEMMFFKGYYTFKPSI